MQALILVRSGISGAKSFRKVINQSNIFHIAFQNYLRKSPILKTGLSKNGLWVPVLHSGVLQYETWHREHLIDDPVNNVGHKSHTILLNSRAGATAKVQIL